MDPYKLMQILAIISFFLGVVLGVVTYVLYSKKMKPRIKELDEKTYSELTLKEMNEHKRTKRMILLYPLLVFILFLFIGIILFFLSVFIPFINEISSIL